MYKTSHFGAMVAPQTYPVSTAPVVSAPLAVRMKPLMGFGQEAETKPMPTSVKIAAVGIGSVILAGIAWLVYREMKLKEQIVAQGGGEALMKYELGKAAGTFAGGLTGAYRPNKLKQAKKGASRSKLAKKLKKIEDKLRESKLDSRSWFQLMMEEDHRRRMMKKKFQR